MLFAAALASWMGWKTFYRPVVSTAALKAAQASVAGEDPCVGKPRCLVIYTAPWCPSCRAAGPTFQELRYRFSESRKVGIKTVVGMDELPALQRYAGELGGAVFMDEGQRFSTQANIRSVPTLLVLDAGGRVLKRQAGAIHDADAQIERLGLDVESLAALR